MTFTADQEKLVEENTKLVFYIAKRYFKPYFKSPYWDDLISGGFYGLTKAAKAYDSDHGSKFSSYACMSILNQMIYEKKKFTKNQRYIPISNYFTEMMEEYTDQERIEYMLDDSCDHYSFEAREILKQLITDLTEEEKDILLSCYVLGQSHREIGARYNRASNTMSVRIKKVRQKLQDKAKELDYDFEHDITHSRVTA